MADEILIRVHRNEKDIGYFTPTVALQWLSSGALRPDDWAYCEGLLDWTPLAELLGPQVAPARPPIPSPPPLSLPCPSPAPPVVPGSPQRPKRTSTAVVLLLSAAAVCPLALLLHLALHASSPAPSASASASSPSAAAESRLESDAGLLPPLKNFDLNAEPIEAIPELGMSKADVANLREWMAAGAPRYWKGKDQFPGMSQAQWERWRKSTREALDKQHP